MVDKTKADLIDEIKKLKNENSSLRKGVYNNTICQQESLLDTLPVGVFKTTLDGKLIFSNKKMAEILGFSSIEEFKNHHIPDFYKDKSKRDELINIIKKNDELKFHEVQLIKKDRSVFWASISEKLKRDKEGNCLYIEGILEDITGRKNNEKEIKKLATLAKQAAISIVLTDLNGNIEYADLLTNFDLGQKPYEYVGKIIKSGIILLNIINDILDMSKIEAGHFLIIKKTFYLKEILENISIVFNHQFENRNLGFSIIPGSNLSEKIYGDMLRTQQVIFNLISNLLKFTLEGRASLNIEYDLSSDKIKFIVKDTGIGIPKDIQENIFGSFFSIRSTKKFDELSTGLGLSICKSITEMIGGKISVSSKSGKGSTFIVELPVNSKNIEDIAPLKDTEIDLKTGEMEIEKNRILIVDDNPVNIELIEDYLIIKGFSKIERAFNGNEAIKVVNEFKPQLILMDKRMPVKDGIETTKYLRDNGFVNPIIMLSADSNEYDRFIIDMKVSEKIKKLYLKDLEDKLKLIEEFIEKNSSEVDLKNIAMIVHTYKGNAGYFGLKCLESLSIELDNELMDMPDGSRINLLEKMVNIIKNIITHN